MPSINYSGGGQKFTGNIAVSGSGTVYTVPANTYASITIFYNLNIITAAPYTVTGFFGSTSTVPGTSGSATIYINGAVALTRAASDGSVYSISEALAVNMQVGPGTVISTAVGGNASSSVTLNIVGMTFTN